MVNNKNIIIIDAETTGLNSSIDEILQLSIIDENKKILLDEYYKPQKATSWVEAETVNGISPTDVADKPPIKKDLSKIQSIIDHADLIIGYNVNFDLGFLESIGIDISKVETYDVMFAFAPIYGEWNEQYGTYKWQKLTKCAAYYNYDWSEDGLSAHNSLADCFATLHCYLEMTKDK